MAADDDIGDVRLDETDRAIVRELQEDGRRAFREIARKVGLSERTVRARVRAMHDAGDLRILAFVDPAALGHSVLALVFLRVAIDAHDVLVEELSSWPEVSYVSSLMGRQDICLQVMCRGNDDLWHLVNHRLRGLEGVLETETMLEMRVHKFRYSMPA
ncbi:MAG: Lrp/AsnC family transcriptional regulator, regulator for asnA, asnC and gidA [Solirubrobacteraceae bacterium]|nr:Lrp/AsnC family transcriptional regulator, regulator for asnA, asnC and gidA [Solirubrobacteraceae bacterium]